MADYAEILDAEIAPESPLTSSVVTRLRDNPLAMLQWASGAPAPNMVPRLALFTADGTWTVPDGVNRVLLWMSGAGGGGGGAGTGASAGSQGGATYVSGTGIPGGMVGANPGAGGPAGYSTGTRNGTDAVARAIEGSSGGRGGQNDYAHGGDGRPGEVLVRSYEVSPGDVLTIDVGVGGTGGGGAATGGDGAHGWVWVMY